ncbi:conserved hypothetical protein [[Clostridium] ultunense Esp]|nr:conserved hypothetical protein [[Clostridium] ultunense Esp]
MNLFPGWMMIEKLVPSLYVQSVYSIDLDALKRKGIRGLIMDLDNTLAEWHQPQASKEMIEWIGKVKRAGFKVVISSNNNRVRVSSFVHPLGVPFIARAKKPLLSSYRRALSLLQLKREEVAVVGDQIFTDILGGNRMGFYTILVVPVAPTDGFFTRLNRMAERRVLRWMKEKGYLSWEVKK